jgi:two-component system nitrogen regulation sensor histidine kinase NtrY
MDSERVTSPGSIDQQPSTPAFIPSKLVGRPASIISHEGYALLLALAAGLPAVVVSMILLWKGDYTPKLQWTLTVLIFGFWFGLAFSLRERVVRPLQTISNLLAALREGDYSIRGRGAERDDAIGAVMLEVNALGETLRTQRLGALEATNLLRTVMAGIDVAVFAFDGDKHLTLVNHSGERLLAQPAERLLGRPAAELGLADCLEGESSRTIQITFPGGMGRWGMRRGSYHEGGLPHELLLLTDLSHALREEERQAWQRLIRVIGHELNNSLAPIKSIAGSLESLLDRQPPPSDWKDDMKSGLTVIATRSDALSRFMGAYSRLARLPQPHLGPVEVSAWARRVVGLETRMPIAVRTGPELTIKADSDQLDQLLINLLKNAVDAALETGGGVVLGWKANAAYLDLSIVDDGPGISNMANLFVPFFTTKPEGSGIGLVLCRQIAEAHGGTLTLENRKVGHGCEARLRLPI